MATSEGVSNASVNTLYGTGRINRGFREQYGGDLNRVRFHKMNGRYDESLIILEGVLAADPTFHEALFLRAQILFDGYRDTIGAKECPIKLMKAAPDKNTTLHRWALSLYRELIREENTAEYEGDIYRRNN